MKVVFKSLAADLLTASIALVLVWGAFSLLDVHDSVMTGDHDEQMLASSDTHYSSEYLVVPRPNR